MKANIKVCLTDSQMGIYLECMRHPESTMYNLPFLFTFELNKIEALYGRKTNKTDTAAGDHFIKSAIDTVFSQHPSLYSRIVMEKDQILMEKTDFPKDGICQVLHMDERGIEERKAAALQPFDLTQSPLCRAEACICGERLHLFIDCHHIVFDGTSMDILIHQFADALAGKNIAPEAVSAFELSEREKELAGSSFYSEAQTYFEQLLSDVETDSRLIFDKKADQKSSLAAVCVQRDLYIPNQSEYLKCHHITNNTFFMGVYGYTLAKMTGQKDSFFMAGESGRKRDADLKDTVGMMVRSLPVVMAFDEKQPVGEMLWALQNQFLTSIKYDCCALGEYYQKFNLRPEVSFVYQGRFSYEFQSDIGNVQRENLPLTENFAPLSLSVFKQDDGFRVCLYYQSDLYSEATINRFLDLFEQVALAFAAEVPMDQIRLLSEQDKKILDEFNDNPLFYDFNKMVPDLFHLSVQKNPEKTAVSYAGHTYSYADTENISNRIAAYLQDQDIKKGQKVGILLSRSETMVFAALGVLKAGAAYQPLDPSYPEERLNFMVKDADIKLLIADQCLLSQVSDYKGPVLLKEDIENLPQRKPLPVLLEGKDDAVLLYTSGTTGTPKGCRIAHGNLLALVHAWRAALQLKAECCVALYASFGFDAHLGDFYPALSCGAQIDIIPEDLRLDLPALKQHCEETGITHMMMTTQVARQFAVTFKDVKYLRCLITGGEKLVSFNPDHQYRFVNAYGPTECTMASHFFDVDRYYDDIPIGKSLPNLKYYIIDGEGRRVPLGVPGELIICGPQVAAGYLNREEQTVKAFISNTFESDPGVNCTRCYKTGDIVRLLPDGNILFIGRRDKQVKIRGFRIELSEVEKVIRDYPGIKDATVIAREVPGSGKCLNAYVAADEKVDISALHRFIRDRKPPYMVPAATMQIDAIPLTPNMKVDQRKLPTIKKEMSASAETRSMTKLEKELFDLVKDIVGTDDFDIETDLTDAGITSISAIRLSVKLYENYDINITSSDILDGCSILKIEDRIVDNLRNRKQVFDTPSSGIEKNQLNAYPLTQTQLGIYLDCLRGGMDTYNIPLLFKIPNSLSAEQLKSAIMQTVQAHPSMCCFIYADDQGNPAIYPQQEMVFDIETEILRDLPPAMTHFTFTEAPLFRFRVIICDEESYLFIEMHHIIADGQSMTVFLEDLDLSCSGISLQREAYTAFDLSLAEQAKRNGEELQRAGAYYDSVFRGISADYLPYPDRNDQAVHQTETAALRISPSRAEDFCKKMDVTQNILFTGVFALTLARYTGHEDALFAVIHNGRTDPRYERMLSMLVKTLPVYVKADGAMTVQDYLKQIDKNLKQLKKYDLYSFADAVRDYGVSADVIFIYQGKMLSEPVLCGEKLQMVSVEIQNGNKAAFSTELLERSDGYQLHMEYDGGRYSSEWIDSFADAFNTCLESMFASEYLKEISITSDLAMEKFSHFNATEWPVPYRPAYRLIEECAQRHPEKIAVICGETKVTYGQLDNMANVLACQILDEGIPVGSAVEILMDRRPEVYVAQIGILKAGGAFLNLSPAYPDERILFVTKDCGAKVILTTHALAETRKALLETLCIPVIFVDDLSTDMTAESQNLEIEPDALSYMIYTSGSTGKPKGVMLTQKNLINVADPNPYNNETTGFVNENSISTALTAFTFDASIMEGYIALANGSTVCIVSEEEIHDPDAFCRMCRKNKVNSILGTPSFLLNLLDYPGFANIAPHLNTILAGGEDFSVRLYEGLRALNPDMKIINGYGPSEATVTCSAKFLEDSASITVGKPLANTAIYCIDPYNHILPMGALGEMVICGDGVGRGYMHREDLTEKAYFILNGKRTYKTGDLALITHNEEIEFHGRIDNQVKLRGLRVELGEIESAIDVCDGVKKSIITVHGDESSRYLAAYYTADRAVSQDEITAQISKTLAEYMIPRVMIQLDTMPLTANGKIDKKALPKPVLQSENRQYIPPETETEKQICAIFEHVLGIEKVGLADDFFALGGTSLTATKVAMAAMNENLPIVYADIFKYPTPGILADAVGKVLPEDKDSIPEEEFSDINSVLAKNIWHVGDSTAERPLGNILLTGATGFLGIHVLKAFLDNEEGEVYCLLRKSEAVSAELKLSGMFVYYFDDLPEENSGLRIHCIEGDITDADAVMNLRNIPFDTVINCAACVKHFASTDILEQVNVAGVEHLIHLCRETGRRLIHVSTTSVAGEGIDETPGQDFRMHENELFFNQILENKYIVTKFKGEQAVLHAAAAGLDAKIMRAGNLMPRRSDGEFQINYLTNGFMRRLKGYYALGCIPYSALSGELEFSPIDETAGAILCLAKSDPKFSVFHTNNTHRVYMSDVVRAMNEVGLTMEIVDEDDFAERLRTSLADAEKNDMLGGLIAYINHKTDGTRYMIDYDNAFTRSVLNRMGYAWYITDNLYLKNALSLLKEIGFFDLNL